MNVQLQQILTRLKKPSVILSLVSQIASILMVAGIPVDKGFLVTVSAMICSALVTLGVLSNPDSTKSGYGDDFLTCSNSGEVERHVLVNGQMVCVNCGAIRQPEQ